MLEPEEARLAPQEPEASMGKLSLPGLKKDAAGTKIEYLLIILMPVGLSNLTILSVFSLMGMA